MPFADVEGQRIHYSDSGGDGPVVVFSHGFFMDHEMFAPQIEELRPTYRSLSVDARGFGLTESDGEPFTYWDLAADLIGVLDHAGVPQAIFVGLSQGGFTTLRVALQYPGRVRGIVLLDTTADAETDEAKVLYRQTQATPCSRAAGPTSSPTGWRPRCSAPTSTRRPGSSAGSRTRRRASARRSTRSSTATPSPSGSARSRARRS